MRYLNLSSEVQVTPDDDKFICGHGSRRLMWVEVNIVRDEEVKEQNGHIIEWVIHFEKIQVDDMAWDEGETILGNKALKRESDIWYLKRCLTSQIRKRKLENNRILFFTSW